MYNNILFSKARIGNVNLDTRLVVAPMTRISGTKDGLATERMKKYYRRYAEGGFPLVITEGLYIDFEHSQGYPNQPGIASAEQVESWQKITAVLYNKGTRMFAQLMHAGALSQYNPHESETIAPSSVKPKGEQLGFYGGEGKFNTPRAMTLNDINNVILSFVNAAKNAREAGFDGIELHGANGYLIDQFITPYTNNRNDEYGGSLENRLLLAVQIIKAVRKAVGVDFPIGIRLSQTKINDFEHAWEGKSQAKQIFKTLTNQGLDYIHTTEADAADPAFENRKPLSKLAKESTSIPIVANGNLEDPEKAALFLKRGNAHFISLAKGALANPNWPEKVKDNKKMDEFEAEQLLMPEAHIKDSELNMKQKGS